MLSGLVGEVIDVRRSDLSMGIVEQNYEVKVHLHNDVGKDEARPSPKPAHFAKYLVMSVDS